MFYLNKIELKNFRCYKDASFSFNDKNKVIFVGKNASGKTSVVEAIYYLGFAKSFKTNNDEEIIKSSEDSMFVRGIFNDKTTIEIGYDGKNKLVKVNNDKVKRMSDLIGTFMISFFCPDDLLLIKGDPKNRRKFIDYSLCQVDKEYLHNLQVVKTTLKERNEYLKSLDGNPKKLNDNYLEALTKTYIDASIKIEKKRSKFITDLDSGTSEIINSISGKKDSSRIEYISNVNVDNFWKTYQEKKMIDIYSKTTTWGVTRDDFKVYINEAFAESNASQGQIRTACLALKLAVMEYYKKKNEKILIILDDVFSELDENRQNKILEMISDDNQVFITTTNINLLTKKALENSEVVEITRGE